MSPTPHWFRRPGTDSPADKGTFNPVYDLLDYPVALGRADDVFSNADEPLTFADALDRVAKFAGVLAAVQQSAPRLLVLEDGLPARALTLAVLAAVRIGSCAVLGAKGLGPGERAAAPIIRPAADPEPARARGARAGMHTDTRHIRSGFEGAELLADGPESTPVSADSLMKQAAFKHAAAAPLGPGREVLRIDGIGLTALESIDALEQLRGR